MRVAMVGGTSISTNIVHNFLASHLEIGLVILEDGIDRATLIRRRMKKLGTPTVVGQLLFGVTVVPALRALSKNRVRQILKEYSLDTSSDFRASNKCKKVRNINCDTTARLLRLYDPHVIVVNGTRVINETLLSCCSGKFINLHAGITPAYRGVHGAYWALYNRDLEHCGVTVHFVDKGIDTGGIIFQETIRPSPQDNYVTYPFLQIAAGLELQLRAIRDIESGTVQVRDSNLPSKLYSHPTLAQYLLGLARHGVR